MSIKVTFSCKSFRETLVKVGFKGVTDESFGFQGGQSRGFPNRWSVVRVLPGASILMYNGKVSGILSLVTFVLVNSFVCYDVFYSR